ncbi:MAG: glycosyl hydrolase [Algibacter sp.]|uniref:glycosyl hydrolase n=1 Tax=Algibacter sp. TaxID=1872428 RepID=UPI003299F779
MKTKLLNIIALFFVLYTFAQTNSCGTIVNDTFDNDGAIPSEWTEYNTSGKVTVVDGRLKFNLQNDTPSAFRSFTPVSNDLSLSFEVEGSRNTMNYQIDLVSSEGKFIASIALGKGTSDIKYANSMEGESPSGYIAGVIGTAKFVKNTTYALSMYIDFEDQTVDFYNSGVLTLENIPFLETSSDFGKIDTKLLYMYSNNGTVHLDNVMITESSELRVSLANAIESSKKVINSAVVGDKYGQYPQTSIDTFQQEINDADVIIENCEATSNEINNAIAAIQSAEENFVATKINDPVLKLYNDYNFTGTEHEVYCGYYNGDLGEYEDWAVSFTLEQGYMVTFAEDVNGLGFSKIYIAQDHALEINLPNELQASISFMRVSPWYPVGKKGSLGNVKWTTSDNYNATWHYDWGLGSNSQGSEYSTPTEQFVPMAWSKGDNWTSIEKMEAIGQNMALNHLMAFNEPDNSGQSNLTVEQALEAYPKLLASGLRLGAPGVENIQYSSTNDSFNESSWIKDFMDGCVERGYRVDFIPAHDYVRRSKSAFLERFKGLHDRYDLPIWVTEYNYGNPNMGSPNITVEQGYNNIKGLTEVLESADFIERYNWYYFFGASTGIGGMDNGQLNITGQFYRDLESQNPSYIQEVYEQGELSVAMVDINRGLQIFPNPVTDGTVTVKVNKSDLSKNIIIKILSTTGQELLKSNNNSNQIDVSNLSNGLYLIQVISGKTNVTEKIIITK